MPSLKTCRTCTKLFTAKGRCGASGGLDTKACKKHRKGRPWTPQNQGEAATEVDFDPSEPKTFVFWFGVQALVLKWRLDHNDHGSWTVQLVGLDDQGVIETNYTDDETAPAFHGEIRIKGVGQNDLFSSFGFQDPSVRDDDGNVINKPKEIKILPARDD